MCHVLMSKVSLSQDFPDMMVRMTQKPDFRNILIEAVEARLHLIQPDHNSAFRLFNGFTEGEPSVTVDLFARTLLLHNYAKQPDKTQV